MRKDDTWHFQLRSVRSFAGPLRIDLLEVKSRSSATSIATQLSKDKDFSHFSHHAFQSVIEAFPKSQKKHIRKMIDRSAESSYTMFGQYTRKHH